MQCYDPHDDGASPNEWLRGWIAGTLTWLVITIIGLAIYTSFGGSHV